MYDALLFLIIDKAFKIDAACKDARIHLSPNLDPGRIPIVFESVQIPQCSNFL